MGSRKLWGWLLVAFGVAWLVVSTVLLMRLRVAEGVGMPGYLRAIWTFVPALMPVGIGAWLLARRRGGPTLEERSIRDVLAALLRKDAVTAEEIARELDLSEERVRGAVEDLVREGHIAGYIEPETGKIHVMDPAQTQPEACPACGGAMEAPGVTGTCPNCGSDVLRPGV